MAITLRICETGTSEYFSSPTKVGITAVVAVFTAAAVLELAATGAAPGTKPSISFFTIRPPSAVPCTWRKSIPFSCAILRAKGDAFTRESSLVVTTAAGVLGVATGAAMGAAAGTGADSAAGAGVLGAAVNNGVTSVPSLPTMAIISFTLAALPFSTPT